MQILNTCPMCSTGRGVHRPVLKTARASDRLSGVPIVTTRGSTGADHGMMPSKHDLIDRFSNWSRSRNPALRAAHLQSHLVVVIDVPVLTCLAVVLTDIAQ